MVQHGDVARFGDEAPGPADLRLPPDPERLAQATGADYHRVGLERRRGDLIRHLMRRADRWERLVDADASAADEALRQIPGVGAWTAANVRLYCLGDPDAVLIGDYHVPNVVSVNLGGPDRADDRLMLELLAPYAGQRGRVMRLINAAGRSAPRRGPKLAPRDIRRQ